MSRDVCATYRLQLHRDFGFRDAADIADYLARLGVSHVYTSPCLQAVPGSSHGYDVVDHGSVNRELGGDEGHRDLLGTLRAQGLGWVLDIVPNHMAITGPDNVWWWDVLENGPASRYASYFDVDWDAPQGRLRNTVLLPVLSDHYGRILEAGELRLERAGSRFTIRCGEHVFPVDPRSLGAWLGEVARDIGGDELGYLADALGSLSAPTAADRASVRRRHRDKRVLLAALERLLADQTGVALAVDTAVTRVDARPDLLGALLDRQNYRLVFWRMAGRDLSYRRFFDINSLIGLRVEDVQVFQDSHRLVLEWLSRGDLDGVRIDHVDGLRDPADYLARLRAAAPGAWLIVEKILARHETLPSDWPVAGTTGYDFLNRVGGLFIDPDGEAPLTELYTAFTGEAAPYAAIARDKKLLILHEVLGADVARLAPLFVEVCERHPRHRDYTRHELREALQETIACLPVYRTYVRPSSGAVSKADRNVVTAAIERAKKERLDIEPALFDFLAGLLRLEHPGDAEAELVLRFQQLSPPATAKGVEDTAFYCYGRFVALNEVGGDPDHWGTTVEAFHASNLATLQARPQTMLATSTHDTKRGEDVRARLAVLTEIPELWAAAVHRWSELTARYRRAGWPDRNAEYFYYQTLVGAWPLSIERAVEVTEKAAREAKACTSWTAPNPAYEAALRAFVEGTLGDRAFMADLERFVAGVIEPGRVNSLAQTLLKLTAPGVPDIYQGTELWSLDLVDPDNRRPVDYGRRRRLLDELATLTVEEIVERMDEGLPKLWVIRQALDLRRRHGEAFGPAGVYQALHAEGPRDRHVVAFLRGERVLTVVPRLVARLGEWKDTRLTLPAASWRNVLTGDRVAGGPVLMDELLRRFPLALLEREA